MSTQTMTDEQTSIVVDTRPETSDDKPTSAHYVLAPDDTETNHTYVMRARFEGFPITALCGFTWVPNKMATGLPVCSECQSIWETLPDTGQGLPRE